MAQIKPAAGKDTLALLFVKLMIGKDAPIDKPAFGIDERFYVHSDSSLMSNQHVDSDINLER